MNSIKLKLKLLQRLKYDFASKEAEYQQLVLDGETEKATALRNEIRTAEKEQIMFEVQQSTTQNIQQSTEVQAIQAKAVELEAIPYF